MDESRKHLICEKCRGDHMTEQHDRFQYACDICPKKFFNKQQLAAHMKIAHNKDILRRVRG